MNLSGMKTDKPRTEKIFRFIVEAIQSKKWYGIVELENYFGISNRAAYRMYYFFETMGALDSLPCKIRLDSEKKLFKLVKG